MKKERIIKVISSLLVIVMLCLSLASCNVGQTDEPDNDGGGAQVGATPSELLIFRMPNKTEYTAGEEFKITGMIMQVVYSDGTKKYLAPTKCERDVDGPLTADITEIIFSYEGVSVKLPISVIKKCDEHIFEFVSMARKSSYLVGETFYEPYKSLNEYPVKAICSECGAEGVISSCTVSSDPMTIDTTSVSVTAVVNNKEVKGSIPVTVYADRVRLEAEAYMANAITEMTTGEVKYDKTTNYALFDESAAYTKAADGATAYDRRTKTFAKGVEIGTYNENTFVEYHFFAEEAGKYEIVMAMAYTNIDAYSNSSASRTADSQINNFLTVKINGREVEIADDVIIRGAGADDGVARSSLLISTFTYISLGEIELFEGENIIKIVQNTYPGYCDLAASKTGGRYASTRLDAIEIFEVE